MQIIFAATGNQRYPVAALRRLFVSDLHPPNAPLFRLQFTAFSRQDVINILKQRMTVVGLPEFHYSSHSFRKEVAQHAVNYCILDENIQRLGRWISNAFELYFIITPKMLFNLYLSF